MTKLGDVVFVVERDPFATPNEDGSYNESAFTVSPAIVTHVYTEGDDPDPKWWALAGPREPVDVSIHRRDGSIVANTVSLVDRDKPYDGGYVTNADYHGGVTPGPADEPAPDNNEPANAS